MARPTDYKEEIADKICDIIATSNRGLSSICADEGMPSRSSVHKWLTINESFADKYARAKQDQADLLAEEILTIADDDSKDSEEGGYVTLQRNRLMVDARKWVASKLKPKSWGDKVDITSGGLPVKQTFVVNGKEIEF